MKKILLNSLDDYFSFARQETNNIVTSIEDLEEDFGIQFGDNEEELSNGMVDLDNVVVKDLEVMPETYPCLMLYVNEKTFDRTGNIYMKMKEYIYLKDFGNG